MSGAMTPEEARGKRLCPNSAIMGVEGQQTPFCHGPNCGAWRWANDAVFRAAVQAEAKRIDEKPPYSKAAATVSSKPVTFGLRGYCGLGGAV